MLNRETPDNPIVVYERIVYRKIEYVVGEIREEEVREPIKKTKNGKAPGVDQITDIALLAPKFEYIEEKTDRLITEAGRVGLCLIASKCRGMRLNATRMDKIRVQDELEEEEVHEFVYLGAKVAKDGGGTEDIKNRLRKTRGVFQSLQKVCSTRNIGKKTKSNLFKTLVRSILLYGC